MNLEHFKYFKTMTAHCCHGAKLVIQRNEAWYCQVYCVHCAGSGGFKLTLLYACKSFQRKFQPGQS